MEICELPEELKLHILGYLDWTTLGRVGQMNKEFLQLSRNTSLYSSYEQQYFYVYQSDGKPGKYCRIYKSMASEHLSHTLFRDNLRKLYLDTAAIFRDFRDDSFKSLEELCLKQDLQGSESCLNNCYLTAKNIRRFAPNIKTLRVSFPIDGARAVGDGLLSLLHRSTRIIMKIDAYQLRKEILDSGFDFLTCLELGSRRVISDNLSNLKVSNIIIGNSKISESALRTLPSTVRSIYFKFVTELMVNETQSEELQDGMKNLSLSSTSAEAALPIEELLFRESDYRILSVISELIDKSTCRAIKLGFKRFNRRLGEYVDFTPYFVRLIYSCERLRLIYLDFHELFGGELLGCYLDIICNSKCVDTLEELDFRIFHFEGEDPFTASELSLLSRLKNIRYFYVLNAVEVSYEDVKKVFPKFVIKIPDGYSITIKHPSYADKSWTDVEF